MKNKTEGVLKTPFNAKDSGLRCQVLTSGSESGAKGQAACPIPPPSSGECEEEAMGVSVLYSTRDGYFKEIFSFNRL